MLLEALAGQNTSAVLVTNHGVWKKNWVHHIVFFFLSNSTDVSKKFKITFVSVVHI